MYKNILVSQVKHIGDAIFTTGSIQILKKRFPEAKIYLLVLPHIEPLFYQHELLEGVLVLNYNSKKTSAIEMFRFSQELKNYNFDLMISYDYKPRPLILGFLAGIKERWAGYVYERQDKNIVLKFSTRFLRTNYDENTIHQSEIFRRFTVGLLEKDYSLEPNSLPQPTKINIDKWEKTFKSAKKKIIFCVRGTHYSKNWSKIKFAKLLDRCAANGFECVILGANLDYYYIEEIKELCFSNPKNIAGKTSLQDLTSLFAVFDLLVSVDTGTGHIAATTDIPIITIFLGSNPAKWRPISKNSYVICSKENEDAINKTGNNIYIKDRVDVDDVYKLIEEIIFS